MIVQIGADGEIFLRTISHFDIFATQKIALESQMFTYRSVLTPVAGEEYAYVILPSVAQVSRFGTSNLVSSELGVEGHSEFQLPFSFGYTDTQEPFFMMVFDTLGVPVFFSDLLPLVFVICKPSVRDFSFQA